MGAGWDARAAEGADLGQERWLEGAEEQRRRVWSGHRREAEPCAGLTGERGAAAGLVKLEVLAWGGTWPQEQEQERGHHRQCPAQNCLLLL